MGHPPFPRGATGPEIGIIQRLHQVADLHRDPEVRAALSGAIELIVDLIEERGKRRSLDDQWDRPHDGG
jgi:hypothetical protein